MKGTLHKLPEGFVLTSEEKTRIAQSDQIDLSGLKPEEQTKIGWWDFEKLAEELYPNSNKLAPHIHITPKIKKQSRHKQHFIKGFQSALDLVSDRKFTVEDMVLALEFGINLKTTELEENFERHKKNFIKFISENKKGPWQVEYEEVTGKFKILALI